METTEETCKVLACIDRVTIVSENDERMESGVLGFCDLSGHNDFVMVWIHHPSEVIHALACETRSAFSRSRSILPLKLDPISVPLSTIFAESFHTPLADIKSLQFKNFFSFNDPPTPQKGELISVVLTKMQVSLNYETAKFPNLAFDELISGKPEKLESVVDNLNWILSDFCGYSLNREEDSYNYFLTKIDTPNSRFHGPPPGLPPGIENTSIYKFGEKGFNLGFDVMQRVVGENVTNRVKGEMWNTMEKFSKVTKFAQERTGKSIVSEVIILKFSSPAQVLEHPLTRPILPLIPPQVRTYLKNSSEAEQLINDYPSAVQFLHQWANDVESGNNTPAAESPVRIPRIIDKKGDFEVLANGKVHHRTGEPISPEKWLSLYDKDGKLSLNKAELRSLVFYSGLEDDIRVDVNEYEAIKSQWETILADAETATPQSPVKDVSMSGIRGNAGDEKEDTDVVSKIKERKYRIEKDVIRTDRTVPFYSGFDKPDAVPPPLPGTTAEISEEWDGQSKIVLGTNLRILRDVLVSYCIWEFELGYVQGMNDLLAPILAVIGEEVDAFFAFKGLMEDMFVNDLSEKIHLDTTLQRAEVLFFVFKEKFDAIAAFKSAETPDIRENLFKDFPEKDVDVIEKNELIELTDEEVWELAGLLEA
ncbi:GTPase activating protein [Nowakowskiella sp. JEL0407]|nr:GTPase activating protein [Nowakowskiella sp. JEL0407]